MTRSRVGAKVIAVATAAAAFDAAVPVPAAPHRRQPGRHRRVAVRVEPLADRVGVGEVELHRGVAQDLARLDVGQRRIRRQDERR